MRPATCVPGQTGPRKDPIYPYGRTLCRNHRIVAIVGRPNVGKSALFNRLAGHRIAIVHDMPGVTRDRLSAPLKDASFPIHVMDTGGIGATIEDDFAGVVRAEAEIAIAASDTILFVVDALHGMHPVDQIVAEVLRKQGKPVILGVNKADDVKHEHNISDSLKPGLPHGVRVQFHPMAGALTGSSRPSNPRSALRLNRRTRIRRNTIRIRTPRPSGSPSSGGRMSGNPRCSMPS